MSPLVQALLRNMLRMTYSPSMPESPAISTMFFKFSARGSTIIPLLNAGESLMFASVQLSSAKSATLPAPRGDHSSASSRCALLQLHMDVGISLFVYHVGSVVRIVDTGDREAYT